LGKIKTVDLNACIEEKNILKRVKVDMTVEKKLKSRRRKINTIE
jgi:hypothetical protein